MDRRLLILRIVFVTYGVARITTNHFLIVYLYEYFTMSELGWFYGCRYFVRFIASICWGYIGDIMTNNTNSINSKLYIFIVAQLLSAIFCAMLLFHSVINAFWISLIIFMLKNLFDATHVLLESAVVVIVEKNAFGKSMFFMAFGAGVGALINGINTYFTDSSNSYIFVYCFFITLTDLILVFSICFVFDSHIQQKETKTDSQSQQSVCSDVEEAQLLPHKQDSELLPIEDADDPYTADEDHEVPVAVEKKMNADELYTDQVKPNGVERIKELLNIICTHYIVVVFNIDLFIFGICHAFVMQCLLIYLLDEFDAPKYLFGLIYFAVVCGDLIIFYNSKYLLIKVGIMGLLIIAHLAYALRVIIYTLIPHNAVYSHLFVIIEPFHGFTYGGMWVASVEYASRISPMYLKSTMIGAVNGIYNGIGTGIGVMLASYLYEVYGGDYMFMYSGIFAIVWLAITQIIFRLKHHFYPNKFTNLMF